MTEKGGEAGLRGRGTGEGRGKEEGNKKEGCGQCEEKGKARRGWRGKGYEGGRVRNETEGNSSKHKDSCNIKGRLPFFLLQSTNCISSYIS